MSRHELLREMVSLTRSIEGLRRDLRSAARREVLAPIASTLVNAAPAARPSRPKQVGNKLSIDQVAAIKAAIARGQRDRSIAVDFAVDRSMVGRIRRGDAWGDVLATEVMSDG